MSEINRTNNSKKPAEAKVTPEDTLKQMHNDDPTKKKRDKKGTEPSAEAQIKTPKELAKDQGANVDSDTLDTHSEQIKEAQEKKRGTL